MNPSLSELVSGLSTADVVDAMGRLHRHRCHVLDLVSPTPGATLFGPAVTISYFPSCGEALPPDEYSFSRLFYDAIGDDGTGKVLVLASNGYTDASMGGGTKMSRVETNHLAGVLTDGRLRDFSELAEYDFSVYCGGQALHWGGDTVTPFEVNRPVVLSGVGIRPGDYIFADASGAAAVPSAQIADVLAEARRISEQDAAAVTSIRSESRRGLPATPER